MADDPRLAVMIQAELDWISSDTAPKGRENRMLAILAALDAHAAAKAPEGTVRKFVGYMIHGEFSAAVADDGTAWEMGPGTNGWKQVAPLPVVPEIEGRVEK